MEQTLVYQNDAAQELTGRVREEQKQYTEEMDAAIDRFGERMAYIGSRSAEPEANPDELLIVLTKAIMDLERASERYERQVNGDPAAIREIRARLRKRTDQVFAESYFHHARVWPQGYPGDYKMIEFLYRNAPISRGAGQYLDRYFLATTLSVAVRERKETLRELIKAELDVRTGPHVLDIACGSCREVFELAPEILRSGATVTCLDLDADALAFSANRLKHAGIPDEQLAFRQYNALRMVNHERNVREFGMQDVIYSVGFFDYLDDEVLVRLLATLDRLLLPGGMLIASFKDSRAYRSFDTSWLLDWDAFYRRREEDMWGLLERSGVDRSRVTTKREASGVILFFSVKK